MHKQASVANMGRRGGCALVVSHADVSLGGGNVLKLCVEELWRMEFLRQTSRMVSCITCTASVEKTGNRRILSSPKTEGSN